MSFLHRKISQSNPLNFLNGGGLVSNIESLWIKYHQKYIATNSFAPVIHIIGLYSVVGYTTKHVAIHKYVTQSRFH